jgi:hypothetical protein
MRLEPGRGPALIGAGLVRAASNPIVAGGDTVTGLGPTTFFPLPRPE